jgi:hypothetical protein
MRPLFALCAAGAAAALVAPGAAGLKIAFLGDTGAELSGSDGFYAKAVFDMVKASGASLIVQNGDFDYQVSCDGVILDMPMLLTSRSLATPTRPTPASGRAFSTRTRRRVSTC